MNPEEDQKNPTQSPDAQNTSDTSSELPSLDQVAADLVSASATETTTPESATTPESVTSTVPTEQADVAQQPEESSAAQSSEITVQSENNTTQPEASVEPVLQPESIVQPESATQTETTIQPETLAQPDTPTTPDVVSDQPAQTTESPATIDQTTPSAEVVSPEPEQQTSFGAVENPDLSGVSPVMDTNLDGSPAESSSDDNDTSTANDTASTNPETNNDVTDASSTDTEATTDNESPSVTSASFIGDAPKPKKQETNPEDEEPLVPAEPVPGSIGSALAYSETAPGHSAPVAKKQKRKLFARSSDASEANATTNGKKISTKTLIVIIATFVLVVLVVIILFFVFSGSSNKNKTSTKTEQPVVTQPVASSLICERDSAEGAIFTDYPDALSASEEIIVMYNNDVLASFGDNLTLSYETPELATAKMNDIRTKYVDAYTALKFTSDPFESSYNAKGTVVTTNRQADGEDIDATSARLLGFTVLKGEVYDDIDTLQDQYETAGFACLTK